MAAASTIARPRRRWLRYSLRTFFLLITAVSIALGLYVKRERDRYFAIEKIKATGSFVNFVIPTGGRHYLDLKRGPGQPRGEFPEEQPQGASWMRQMLGKYGKYHGSPVLSIHFGRNIISPKDANFDIELLAPLNEIKHLHLSEPFTDDDLVRLPSLPHLEHLQLLSFDPYSDRGLSCLDRMPNLKGLIISCGDFSDSGFAHIASRQKLTILWLNYCEFSEPNLDHLAQLPNLNELFLENCAISDRAVPRLAGLHQLKRLYITNTNMTKEGVATLTKSLPKCSIVAQYGPPEPRPRRARDLNAK